MPFWGRFKPKEDPRSKVLEKHSSKSLRDGVAFSLQSFGLTLLRQESAQTPKQNVFISPLSTFLALAMTENGASGETKAAMRKVLALPTDANEETFNECVVTLMKSLQSQGKAELAIANALWLDAKSTISSDFVSVCEKIYDSAVQRMDLSQPSSASRINAWVSEKTRGKIPTIVTPNGIRGLPAILTNALYFKGKFWVAFPKEATRLMAFHLTDGREKVVPMMRIAGLHDSYRSGKKLEAAVLHYKESGIALYMLLPNRGTSPEEILTEESVQELQAAEGSVSLDLSMPRFAIDFNSCLKESLTRLGMGIAFQCPGADFSALGSPLFSLGEVIHKTHLEVDEEGTVAAAATVMGVRSIGRPPRVKRKTLVFDRPFAVLLRDRTTGTIVFVGVVYEP
jgi:serine protease inhibitor